MLNNSLIEPFAGFLIRTHHFPFSKLKETLINNSFNIDLVKKLIHDPVFMEAIFLSSKNLYHECIKLRNSNLNNEKNKKIVFAILQYYIRISSRSTPFGIFAGIGFGEWNTENNVEIKEFKYSMMPDMELLENISEHLIDNYAFLEKSQLFINSSLYKIGNEYRYLALSKKNNTFKLVKVNESKALHLIIEAAETGIYYKTLSDRLKKQIVDSKKSEELIKLAIENQLLYTDLSINISEDSYLNRMLAHYNSYQECSSILKKISGSNISESENIPGENSKSQLSTNENFEESFSNDSTTTYSNLYFSTKEATLDEKIINTLSDGIKVLLRIQKPKAISGYLHEFKNKFLEKYDQKEVMLLKVLDPETGIQFQEESLNSYEFPINQSDFYQKKKSYEFTLNNHLNYLLKLINVSSLNNSIESEILDKDLPDDVSYEFLPETFNAYFQILNSNTDQHSIYLKSISGPSANCLIGRFGKVSNQANDILKEISSYEMNAYDPILMEVDYNPGGKVANVLRRNYHFAYKTSILKDSKDSSSQNIPLKDLLLSIRNDKIVLKSHSLDREVIPCNSTAHNYTNSNLNIYRFLSELQTYYMGGSLYFDWGQLESFFSFLPRIKYKNIILSPATWILSKDHIKEFTQLLDKNEVLNNVLTWRKRLKIPSKILLTDHDNDLLINMRNSESINLFASIIKKRKTATITEFLLDKSDLITGKDGFHLHEIVAPFKKRK